MRRLGITLGCAAAALAVLAPSAGAATIVVDEFDDQPPGGFGDLGCSIRDAIQSANDNADFTEFCTSTGGYSSAPDTIVLPGGSTSTLNLNGPPNNDDDNLVGDIDIEGPVTITTSGPGLATVDAGDTGIVGGQDLAPLDRVFHIESNAGAVTLNSLRVTGGLVAHATSVGGGGILTQSDLTIRNSEIVNNVALQGNVNSSGIGGGILARGPLARLTVTGSTVAGNTVQTDDFNLGSSFGGGVAAFPLGNGGTPPLGVSITNSTISGNRSVAINASHASGAGGIFTSNPNGDRTPTILTNVTITDNEAAAVTAANASAGGIQMSTGTITGSLVAENEDPPSVNFDDCRLNTTSGGGNLIGKPGPTGECAFAAANDSVGTTASPINPNIGPLLINGGLTRTHLLNQGSPAIDRGGTCPATDQTGLFRYIAAPCDAGALEIGATATPPPSVQAPVTQPPVVTPPARSSKCPKGKKPKKVKGKVKCVKKKRKKK